MLAEGGIERDGDFLGGKIAAWMHEVEEPREER